MFGAPSFSGFGQQNQQSANPAAPGSGGMFGQTNTQPSFGAFGQTGGTSAFGQTQPSAAFGQPAGAPQQSPFSFGQSSTSSFGAPKPATGFGAFGTSSTTQPAPSAPSFGFGSQPTQPTAFGQPAQQPSTFGASTGGGGFFGQSSTTQPTTFGGFGGTPLGGQTTVTQGTATTPYVPYREDATPNEPKAHAKNWDVHQSLTMMPAYANMSQEELRLMDYRQGRQKGTGAPGTSTQPAFGGFGAANTQPSAPLGQPSTGLFGQQPQQPQQPSTGLFGQPSSTPSAFGTPQNNTGGLFGQNKPAGTAFGGGTSLFGQNSQPATGGGGGGGLFGQSTTQPSQPSTGFGFGQNNTTSQPASSGFSFGANSQANKPAFGGFGASQPSQPQSTFSFGSNANQTQPSATPFGGASSNTGTGSTFSFGATNNTNNTNQPKPGGLFGSAPSASGSTPSFGGFGASQPPAQQNKPAFSFGGFGTQNNNSSAASTTPSTTFGQNTSTANPSGGGLFGQKPATNPSNTGFSFGGASQSAPQTGFGANNSGTSTGGGLFGAKPAQPSAPSGGLFGASSGTQQPSTGFGQSTAAAPSGGGLFGANSGTQAQKPAFSFGSSAPAPAPSTGTGSSGGGGLFGASQPAAGTPSTSSTGGGLFGASQPASSGGLFGTQTASAVPKPLGASAPAAPAPGTASPASLTTNPYGTDALLATATAPSAAAQPPLPFNVAPKSKPPLVSPFRSSPRNAVRVTRLRGSTPALDLSPRERTPLRESTPGLGGVAHSTTPVRSGSMLFRGPSDTPGLSPQAFIPRSTSKRLVLDGDTSVTRSPSVRREPLGSTPRPRFSPAVERAAEQPVAVEPEADLSVSRELPRVKRSPRAAPRAPERGDYVLSPPLHELRAMEYAQLASLPAFRVARIGFGEVAFTEPVDLASLPDLSCIGGGVVQLRAKECFVYPQEEDLVADVPLDGLQPGYVPVPKAPLGHGLNVPARVSLEGCWPLDRATREPLKDASHPRVKQHIAKLKNKKETTFVSYAPESGTWTFEVPHFSRYGLDDSESEWDEEQEEEEDTVPATQLGAALDSDASSSHTQEESEPLSEEEANASSVPAVRAATLRRSTTPGVRFDAPTPGALPRKVQVMRASFFGHTPPPAGPAAGVSWGPTYEAPPRLSPPSLPSAPLDEPVEEAGMQGGQAEAGAAETRAPSPTETPHAPPIPVARVPLRDAFLGRGLYASDAGLSLGRSFRIGWGPGARLVHNGTLHKAALPSVSQVVMDRVRVTLDASPDAAQQLAEALLTQQLVASDVRVVDEVPLVTPKPGTSFQTHAQHYAADDKRYAAQFWHLGSALFDPLRAELPPDAPRALHTRVERLRRKRAVSQWLTRAAAPQVQREARAHRAASRHAELVFALLSGFQVEQAAEAALEAGDVRLATLVAQAGGDASTKAFVAEQLDVWAREEVAPHVARPMQRVYELLCGRLQAPAQVAAGLDWRRALGLHVWYGVPWEAPLGASVASYTAALAAQRETQTQPPLPPYYDAAHLGALKLSELAARPDTERDAMFELVQLHVDDAYPLEHVLNARNFGASATDHTLPWHTYVLLAQALHVRDFADAETGARLTLAYAAQLEAQGLWRWAAFVLLHLASPAVRRRAVRALLARHVAELPAAAAFLDTLAVPAAWRAGAAALAARAAGDPYREYEQWLAANEWSAAHEVAVTYLAPEAFVRGNAALLLDLLRPFGDAEEAARAAGQPFRVARWNTHGRVLLDYATLPHIVPPLLAKSASNTLTPDERHALQQATHRTHELIACVYELYPPTQAELMPTVARSEMLVVLHNLARLIAAHAGAQEPVMHWTPAHPPETEQLHAAAADFGAAMLASL